MSYSTDCFPPTVSNLFSFEFAIFAAGKKEKKKTSFGEITQRTRRSPVGHLIPQ